MFGIFYSKQQHGYQYTTWSWDYMLDFNHFFGQLSSKEGGVVMAVYILDMITKWCPLGNRFFTWWGRDSRWVEMVYQTLLPSLQLIPILCLCQSIYLLQNTWLATVRKWKCYLAKCMSYFQNHVNTILFNLLDLFQHAKNQKVMHLFLILKNFCIWETIDGTFTPDFSKKSTLLIRHSFSFLAHSLLWRWKNNVPQTWFFFLFHINILS